MQLSSTLNTFLLCSVLFGCAANVGEDPPREEIAADGLSDSDAAQVASNEIVDDTAADGVVARPTGAYRLTTGGTLLETQVAFLSDEGHTFLSRVTNRCIQLAGRSCPPYRVRQGTYRFRIGRSGGQPISLVETRVGDVVTTYAYAIRGDRLTLTLVAPGAMGRGVYTKNTDKGFCSEASHCSAQNLNTPKCRGLVTSCADTRECSFSCPESQ